MDFSKSSIKLFVKLFVIISIFFIGGAVVLRLYKENKYPDRFEILEQKVEIEGDSLPQIVNSPVERIDLDDDFIFIPSLAPSEDESYITLISSPDWVFFEEGVLFGSPSDSGNYNFVLRVQKGDLFYDQNYYLIVYDSNNE